MKISISQRKIIMKNTEDKPATFILKLSNILRVTTVLCSRRNMQESFLGIMKKKESESIIKKNLSKVCYLVSSDITSLPRSLDNSTCIIFTNSICQIIPTSSTTRNITPKSTFSLSKQGKPPSNPKKNNLFPWGMLIQNQQSQTRGQIGF